MPVREQLLRAVVRQFGHPTGLLGRVVGQVMAHRPSNLERNRRTLDLLGIRATDRVLEIGFGPGLALAWAAEMAPRGKVVGIDHSEVMLRQASRRNASAIAAARMELHLGSIEDMPAFEAPFDKAFLVNVYMFWSDGPAGLRRVAAALRPGGTLAITHLPRNPGATAADTDRAAVRIAADLRTAGFQDIRAEMLPLKPLPAVCLLASRPGGSGDVPSPP